MSRRGGADVFVTISNRSRAGILENVPFGVESQSSLNEALAARHNAE